MDKTIKINLGGSLFQIDEEAYKILHRYLKDIDDRLKNTQGGAETIEDLELRIAEIFNSQGVASAVISKENVEAMMAIIGKPEDFDTGEEPVSDSRARQRPADSKKLYRNPDDMILSGVCGGLAPFLNIDAVWIRLAFIIFTFFFFIGALVYIALWIALPKATSDARKREMYGRNDFRSYLASPPYSATSGTTANEAVSSAGHAINEIFRAVGKVFFIILRIFLIITGVVFVVGGFTALVAYIMVFFLKYPGYFSTGAVGTKLFYLPDFLSYIVNPAIAPWMIFLLSVIIILPLLAFIYWGVKMIFWFRARDGIISLAGLVIWVISLAAFSILLFNEGVGFAEMSGSVSEEEIVKAPRDLYISAGKTVENLKFDKDITFDREYTVFLNDANKEIHITSELDVNPANDESMSIELKKRATGRSRSDASRKAQEIIYNYSVSGDTIKIDEYFTIPAGSKWSVNEVKLELYIPVGTTLHFDKTTREMFSRRFDGDNHGWDYDNYEYHGTNSADYTWVMTNDGLRKKTETDRIQQ